MSAICACCSVSPSTLVHSLAGTVRRASRQTAEPSRAADTIAAQWRTYRQLRAWLSSWAQKVGSERETEASSGEGPAVCGGEGKGMVRWEGEHWWAMRGGGGEVS